MLLNNIQFANNYLPNIRIFFSHTIIDESHINLVRGCEKFSEEEGKSKTRLEQMD